MGRFRCSGGIMVFLGALFWSLNSPLVKFLTLNALLICGLRSVIAAVALLPTIRPKQLRWNGWMLMYVCSYAGLCVSVILALSLTSAPVAVGMQYTATIWLFLLGLVQKKPFTLRAFFPVLFRQYWYVTAYFGMCLFITSGISGTPLKNVIKEIWGPIVVMLIVLLIITFVPESVLFLPKMFGLM